MVDMVQVIGAFGLAITAIAPTTVVEASPPVAAAQESGYIPEELDYLPENRPTILK